MRGSKGGGARRAAGALCAGLMLARPAAAHEMVDPFAGETPVPDAELAQLRGGFEIMGIRFDLRISVRDLVNGYEVQHAVMELVNSERAGEYGLVKVLHTMAQGKLPTAPQMLPEAPPAAGADLAQAPLAPAPEVPAPSNPAPELVTAEVPTPEVAPAEVPVPEVATAEPPATEFGTAETVMVRPLAPEPTGGEAAAAPAQPEAELPAVLATLPAGALSADPMIFALINTANGLAIQRDVQFEITLGTGGALGNPLEQIFSQTSNALLDGQLGAAQP
jgi:hypothetical protein